MFDRIVNIPASNLNEFNHALLAVNKRANKLGLPEVQSTLIKKELKQVEKSTFYEGKETVERFNMLVYSYQVVGTMPQIEGYTLIGSVEFIDGLLRPVINSFHDNSDYDSILKGIAEPVCDHCKTNRQRKKVFIVLEKETSKVLSIGSSCMKLYFPGKDIESILSGYQFLIEFISDISDYESVGNVSLTDQCFTIEQVIMLTLADIEERGYITSQNEELIPTATNVKSHFDGNPLYKLNPTENHASEAKKIIEWLLSDKFKNLVSEARSSFFDNILNFVESNNVPFNRIGYICYTPILFYKESQVKKVSNFVGVVGEKVNLPLTLINIIVLPVDYYNVIKTLYILQDDKGNCLKWFNSGKRPDVTIGQSYQVKGTVKEHKNYKGCNETLLTRCKFC